MNINKLKRKYEEDMGEDEAENIAEDIVKDFQCYDNSEMSILELFEQVDTNKVAKFMYELRLIFENNDIEVSFDLRLFDTKYSIFMNISVKDIYKVRTILFSHGFATSFIDSKFCKFPKKGVKFGGHCDRTDIDYDGDMSDNNSECDKSD